MVFGTRHKIKRTKNINLNIRGEMLQVVPTYKYLDINLDQTLSFNYHLKYVANLISHKLYVFCKIRKYLNDHAALTIYKTMILPYFDYGDAIFMYSKSPLLKKLDKLHLRGLKISSKLDSSITDEKIFNTCQISNLENRRTVHLRNFMFNRKGQCNCINEEDNICTRNNTGPIYNVLKPNCESFKRNVCYSGAVEWNNLEANIRNSENIFMFKKIQKTWLTNTYS